jgi:NAD(P)-dependent dehydrogenase (short-subunit alcohol dehydrogenase family)
MSVGARRGLVEDKVALVTGAGSGIGRATALLFAREGATVLVVDVDEARALETVASIENEGFIAAHFVADISRVADANAMVQAAVDRWGRLDCAHNNAGIGGPPRPLDEYTDAEFDAVIRVNVYGTFNCMRAELRHMVPSGAGTIVNTSSATAVLAVPGHAAYTGSKAAVNGMTKAAAREYAETGVRINAVMPGAIATERGFAASERQFGGLESALRDFPLGRLGETSEVAEAVVWLSSDRSSFVLGECLLVDGGFYSAHQKRPQDEVLKKFP